MSRTTAAPNNSIVCTNAQGAQITGSLVQVTPYQAVFEIYHPLACVRLSEVFPDFKITVQNSVTYLGRAVISKFVNLGSQLLCEAILEEPWADTSPFSALGEKQNLAANFKKFIREWEKLYQVMPEMKILVTDMESLLTDLRGWMNHVEMGFHTTSEGNGHRVNLQIVDDLAGQCLPLLNGLFEKFEELGNRVPAESKPAHHVYIKRQLHPLLLCSPFAHRTYQKPLGYAGDYEMVNMILRDPREGASLFAKVLNVWFIRQPPAEAHRNRVDYLAQTLRREAAHGKLEGRRTRVWNIGCGPAREIQDFLKSDDLSNEVDFTLLDFNEETIDHATLILSQVRRENNRRAHLNFVRKSVAQLLKAAERSTEKARFDFIYCAGLFDYLPDRVCSQLIQHFYRQVVPGGLVLVTNVDPSNPIQNMLDYVLEWHLLYRNGSGLRAVCPKEIPEDEIKVWADQSGVNIFLEIRKHSAKENLP